MTPISAIGRRAGFTLVEIMVVVAIIGLAASVVLLSAPDPRPNLGAEADRFAARLVHARDEAVMTNRTIEVRLADGGYDFGVVGAGVRRPLDERPFGRVRWVEGTKAELLNADGQSRIAFDATGQSEPAQVRLTRGEQQIAIIIGAAGKVEIDAPGR